MNQALHALPCLMLLLVCWEGRCAQTNSFSGRAKELWLTGRKQQLHELALMRLERNSNDLACLLVKLDFQTEFFDWYDKAAVLGTLADVNRVARSTTNAHFSQFRDVLEKEATTMPLVLDLMTPEMMAEDRHKGYLTNKPLASDYIIEALEADGLVPPPSAEEIAFIEANPQRAPWPPADIWEKLHELHPEQFPPPAELTPAHLLPFRKTGQLPLRAPRIGSIVSDPATTPSPERTVQTGRRTSSTLGMGLAICASAVIGWFLWRLSRR